MRSRAVPQLVVCLCVACGRAGGTPETDASTGEQTGTHTADADIRDRIPSARKDGSAQSPADAGSDASAMRDRDATSAGDGATAVDDAAAALDAAPDVDPTRRCIALVGSRECPRPTVQVAAGDGHTCALLNNGVVKCWGRNTVGQLGLGRTGNVGTSPSDMGANLEAVDLGTGRTAKAISAGFEHTCAILDDDSVKCWGNNDSGRLGLGDALNRGQQAGEMGDALARVDLGTGRTAKAISAGETHTCAVLDDDSVKCWGDAGSGRLGIESTEDRGDQADEMGNALPTVLLGTGRTAKAISASGSHTCAILDDDTLKCWGYSGGGRLGLGELVHRGRIPGDMGDNLPAVDLGTGRHAIAVAAGNTHTCALLDDASIKCWGDGTNGVLGSGTTLAVGDEPGEMGDMLPTVELGTGRTAVALVAGTHNCALLDDDSVKCWGDNLYGQLGLGDTTDRGDMAGQMGDALALVQLGTTGPVTLATSHGAHACAWLQDGTLRCWGGNNYGELGLGDVEDRGDQPGEMGSALPIVSLGR